MVRRYRDKAQFVATLPAKPAITIRVCIVAGLLFLFLIAPLVAGAVQPSSEACRSVVPDPRIAVRVHSSAEPVFKVAPSAQIAKQVGGHVDQIFFGLTRAALGGSIQINPRIQALDDEWLCLSPDIEIRLYFDKMIVTTASELENDSCARDHVIEHELQHVEFHLEALNRTADAIRAFLRREFPPSFRYVGVPGDFAFKRQQASLGIAAHVQGYYRQFNVRHREIDNYVELQRSYQVCNGAILRLASARQMYATRDPQQNGSQTQ